MYTKIIKDLNQIDPLNAILTKKILGRLSYHIDSSISKGHVRSLPIALSALQDYLSANNSRFHKEMQENSSQSYKIKRFLNELLILIDKCENGIA